jgi:endonuclease/exonuclease/phosphatase family metal-dependent hydrolase
MGRDGKISPNRIAGIIARHDPDIIALQELKTNEQAHQAQIIAQKLAMKFHFHQPGHPVALEEMKTYLP